MTMAKPRLTTTRVTTTSFSVLLNNGVGSEARDGNARASRL